MRPDLGRDVADDRPGRPTVLRFRRTVAVASAGASFLAIVGLLGYLPVLGPLGSIAPDHVPMAPSTAGCLLILSAALFLHTREPRPDAGLKYMVALVPLVTIFSLLDLAGSLAGMNLNFEDSLVVGATLGAIPIGRMSPVTAVAFLMTGLGVLLLLLESLHPGRSARLANVTSVLGILTLLLGAVILLAYFSGTPLMYGGATVPMAASTAAALLCLGTACVAAAGPESFPAHLMIGESTSARLTRAFLPLSVAGVLVPAVLIYLVPRSLEARLTSLVIVTLMLVAGALTASLSARLADAIGTGLDEATGRLQASEAQHRAITATAYDTIITADSRGIIVGWNQAAEIMFGYTESEAIGLSLTRLMPERYQSRHREGMSRVVAGGEHHVIGKSASLEAQRRDGTVFPVALSLAEWKTGNVVFFTAIIRDMTESEQAAAALRESEARYRALVEWSPEPVVIHRAGTLLYANPASLGLLGATSADALTGTAILDRIPQAGHQLTLERATAIQAGAKLGMNEMVILKLDGTALDVEAQSTVIVYEDRPAIMTSLHDITMRRLAEAELRTLSRAMEQSPVSMVITDRDGNITYVNPRFEQVSGYTRAEAIGKNPRILQSGMTPPETYREMWQTIADGGEWHGELCNRRKSGELFWESVSISGLADEQGRIRHYIGVKEDMTERMRERTELASLQAQLTQTQKMESIGRLAGGVAHDFNNMLTAIMGYAELTAHKVGSDHAAAPLIEEIRKAAVRSTNLTRKLLAFARRQPTVPALLDLNEAIEDIMDMLRRLLGEQVEVVWTPGLALWKVTTDASQIDQVLANLAVNARDAMTRSDGRLEIATSNVVLDEGHVLLHPGAREGEFVCLRVSDNGLGMDAHTLAHVCEPFFTTKAPGKGTGLGMSTVYGIMQQSNGFIDIDSTLGLGSTFRLYLPRAGDAAEVVRGALEH